MRPDSHASRMGRGTVVLVGNVLWIIRSILEIQTVKTHCNKLVLIAMKGECVNLPCKSSSLQFSSMPL